MLFLLFISSLLANPILLHEPKKTKGTIVILEAPDWSHQHYAALIEQLKKNKLTLWSFQTAHFKSSEEIRQALLELNPLLKQQPSAIVAHGFSGTILAPLLLSSDLSPQALVLIGTPLYPHCSRATIDALSTTQNDFLAEIDLIYGSSSSIPLHPQVSEDLLTWCHSQESYALHSLTHPTLGFGSALDAVAPPETMRLALADNYVRIGPLSLLQEEPLHYELIAHPAMLLLISRWLKKEL